MRAGIVVAVIVGTAGPAIADSASVAAVEKVVRANIDAAFTSHTKLDATLAKDAQFHPAFDSDDTSPWFTDKCGDKYCNDAIDMFGETVVVVKQKLAPYKVAIVVDDVKKVGWFSTELKVSARMLEGSDTHPAKTNGTWPVRVIGVVVDDAGTWKVAAEKFSLALSDAKLLKGEGDTEPNYGALTGAVEKEIAAWFPKGITAKQSPRASVVNGTAPGELGRDKAKIGKLVKTWDRLELKTQGVEWTTFASGAIGWAHVALTIPMKGGKKVKRLSVGIIAVPEEGGWRWVALSWSPEVASMDAAH
jgi:hypothetical protein